MNIKMLAGLVLPLVEGTFGKFSQDATLAKMALDEVESGLQRLSAMGHQIQLTLEGPNAPQTTEDKLSAALNISESINTSLTLALSKLEEELATTEDALLASQQQVAASQKSAQQAFPPSSGVGPSTLNISPATSSATPAAQPKEPS